jgi:serine protease
MSKTSLLYVCLFLACVCLPFIPVSGNIGTGSIRRVKHKIKDQYIVKLKDTLSPTEVHSLAGALASNHGGKLHRVWDTVVPAFFIELPEPAAAAISHHPLVDFVEENAEWTISQVQTNAPWHLDRIDQRLLPLDGSYKQGCNVTDVFAYVLDGGVRGSHREFWTNSSNSTSRVLPGKNFISDGFTENSPCTGVTVFDAPSPPCGSFDRECANGGHGTAVASVLGGLTYGVAKGVKIIPVRTFYCTGFTSSDLMIEGLKWIYEDKPTRNGPAVLNISAGGISDQNCQVGDQNCELTTELWINKLINERNITVVVSANNQEILASQTFPARMARGNGGKVITVGGSTNNDRRWHCNPVWEDCGSSTKGSNYGNAVDIFAPSQNIRSAGIKEPFPPGDPLLVYGSCCRDSDTAERQLLRSGTSFAAPIVAGIAARLLIGSGSTLTPDQIWTQIQTQASGDFPSTPPTVMQDVGTTDPDSGPLFGSPNRLVFQPGVTRCRAVGS